MGHAYNESYNAGLIRKKLNFSNKLFAAWDFKVTDNETIKFRRKYIKVDFLVSALYQHHYIVHLFTDTSTFYRKSLMMLKLEQRSNHGAITYYWHS